MNSIETSYKEWTFKALSDIWTGDLLGKPDRLIMTGLLGSIRWWFEVLVRGLGGYACDPTSKNHRCPNEEVKKATKAGHHCVVCELFGCTDWGRKFRFEVLTENGEICSNQIKKGSIFKLRFTPLRPIQREEWALIDLTLRLISEYGAIGGKTVYKPSDEQGRNNEIQHLNFGLIQLTRRHVEYVSKEKLIDYIIDSKDSKWRKADDSDFHWASLKNFWFVKDHYLARQNSDQSSYNRVIGREESKAQAKRVNSNIKGSDWLSGNKKESKKVFSFKNPGRTYGFIKPGEIEFDEMLERLMEVWASDSFSEDDFKKKEEIVNDLFLKGGEAE